MKTVEIKIYSFAELSEEAQQKVLKNLYDINLRHDWFDYILEEYTEILKEKGFENAKIQFSGFCSQGDGASFDADINLSKFTNNPRFIAINKEHTKLRICKNSYHYRYCHERTRYTDFDQTGRQNIDKAFNNYCNLIEAIRLDLCKEIYRTLEKQHDYLMSEKAIIETIEANEYEFTEDGETF